MFGLGRGGGGFVIVCFCFVFDAIGIKVWYYCAGHMLQIVTERLLNTDFVYMGFDLFLAGQEHCLAFSYHSTSTAKIEVGSEGRTTIGVQRENVCPSFFFYFSDKGHIV